MPEKKYSKERLEKSRKLFLGPKVDYTVEFGIKRLNEGDMTEFVQSIASVDSSVEHHIINNCANAENEETRIDCITKANDIKIRSINRLSEALVDKCGGDMYYVEEDR